MGTLSVRKGMTRLWEKVWQDLGGRRETNGGSLVAERIWPLPPVSLQVSCETLNKSANTLPRILTSRILLREYFYFQSPSTHSHLSACNSAWDFVQILKYSPTRILFQEFLLFVYFLQDTYIFKILLLPSPLTHSHLSTCNSARYIVQIRKCSSTRILAFWILLQEYSKKNTASNLLLFVTASQNTGIFETRTGTLMVILQKYAYKLQNTPNRQLVIDNNQVWNTPKNTYPNRLEQVVLLFQSFRPQVSRVRPILKSSHQTIFANPKNEIQ